MKQTKRLIACALALIVLCTALAGCAKQKEQRVIGTCAGTDVLYEELRYVTLLYKDAMASTYGDDIWDTPESAEQYRKELEDTVWRMMCNNYAVLAACRYYAPHILTADTLDQSVEEKMEELETVYGSKNELKKALKEMYMTENFVRFCLLVSAMENELFYVLTDDGLGNIIDSEDEFLTWMEAGNYVHVQHVFIRNDPTDSIDENRTLANSTQQRLASGTPIGEIINSAVNEDLSNVSPYYIVREVYVKELEDAAFTLKNAGDVSPVVETGDGFYIFVQIEHTREDLLSELSSLLQSYQWAKVEDIVNGFKDDLVFELNDYGKSIDLLSIK